jgi:hypothetical protein
MSKKKRAKAQARHPHTDERLVIRVQLLGTEPEIWRRISLDPELTLYQVHEVLQVVFEWENDHLHTFIKKQEARRWPQLHLRPALGRPATLAVPHHGCRRIQREARHIAAPPGQHLAL